MKCREKHTIYDPPVEMWICPECGSKDIAIDYWVDDEAECGRLHVGDYVTCFGCSSAWKGEEFAKILQKIANLVTCPTCAGAGVVSKEKTP